MVNKDFSQKGSLHIIIIGILASALIGALGFVYWSNSVRKDSTQEDLATQDARPDIGNVLTLNGKVTMKLESCGAKSLYPEENTRRYAVCDRGKGIRVDDKIISTSSGGPAPGFYVNTDSINLGDVVSVRYVIDKDSGGASLNCRKCSITVTESGNL